MKKLLKLIFIETSFLKKTLAVILIILTAFGAALLAVLSVLSDMPRGMIAGIDASKKYYFGLYGGECFALSAKEQTADLAAELGAEFCYGVADGITQNTELRKGNNIFLSDLVTILGENKDKLEYRVARHGYFVPADYADKLPFEGASAASGIWICNEIANSLAAQTGDVIYLGDSKATVLGVFDRNNVFGNYAADDVVVPAAWYYVIGAEDVLFDTLYFTYPTAKTVLDVYKTFGETAGLKISGILSEWMENIAVVQTYYSYLAILLGLLMLLLLYALFSTFYRARKTQMCRFKVLGATNTAVTAIYLTIALSVIVLSVLFASVLSVFLSKFLLDLCSRLFTVSYPYTFRAWLPLSLLGVCVVICIAIFILMQWRISRLPIAAEVRYE